ncbi:MAG: response regulator [Terriglobales bacterium]
MLDYRMPHRDGLDACAVIRTMPNYSGVPIVLLTAYDSGDLRRRAANAGATTVFSKPFTIDELREAVMPLVALGRDRATGRTGIGLAETAGSPDAGGLTDGRQVLAVLRKVDQAAEQRRFRGSFVEAMASLRAKSLR